MLNMWSINTVYEFTIGGRTQNCNIMYEKKSIIKERILDRFRLLKIQQFSSEQERKLPHRSINKK